MSIHPLILSALVATLATVSFAPGSAVASPSSSDVRVWPAKVAHVSIGEVSIDASPEDVYRAITDYALWDQIFPTVARVRVVEQSGARALVELVSIDGKSRTLRFGRDASSRALRFSGQDGVAEVAARIDCEAGARPGTTRLRAILSAKVTGVARLFVSSDKVRDKREEKLQADLTAIHAYFADR